MAHPYPRLGRAGTDAEPPVVLVHGLIVASTYMVATAVRLASEYWVYAPDLPGFGDSDKPPQALDVPELAGALVAWMDEVGLERPVLIGNSFGCQIVVDVAARYPTWVQRAMLQVPTMDRFASTLWQQIGRGLLDLVGEHPSQLIVVAHDFEDRAAPIDQHLPLRSAGPDRG
ncbi:MAG TPA: alpha/beta hydrolase [Thermomicrobiales bacterium]|nr:alpha/beta hydrolase [Thermomicrobiales bacterium]